MRKCGSEPPTKQHRLFLGIPLLPAVCELSFGYDILIHGKVVHH
jgi:hypothetical protein